MKPHSRSQGLASSSRLCLKSKCSANQAKDSSNKPITISKYFTSSIKSEASSSAGAVSILVSHDEQSLEEDLLSTSDESPYKSSLTEIKNINVNTSLNEIKDFKTPKRICTGNFKQLKANNVAPKNNPRKRGRKPKASKTNKKFRQTVLIKTANENLSDTDTNPEHLQLAIALSRSLQDNHKQESEDETSSTSALYPTTQQKVESMREVLKQFGFKSNSNKLDVLHQRIPIEKKKKKRSRFQHITPILLLRTHEDRERILSEKIASILSRSSQENVGSLNYRSVQDCEPTSRNLKEQWSEEHNLYKMSNFEPLVLKNADIFYVKTLNIPPTETKCGSLLRDWGKIPGREKSPIRSLIYEKPSANSTQKQFNKTSEESFITNSSKTSSNMMYKVANGENNSLIQTIKTDLHSKSLNKRSISPELFESDDEIMNEIPQKLSVSLNDEHSPSLLNLTPQKSNSVSKVDSDVSDGNCNFKSVSNLTPPKKDQVNHDNMLTNCNDIHTFKSLHKDNVTSSYFDLTQLSDEENLFKSNDKILVKTPVKNLLQELLASSDDEPTSQSLLNLTPRKNKSLLRNNSTIKEDYDTSSTKMNKINGNSPEVKKDEINVDDAVERKSNKKAYCLSDEETLPLKKSKYKSFNLIEDDFFENDKGICTFESFSKENNCIVTPCFDLTLSSDEEDNKANDEKDISICIAATHSSNTSVSAEVQQNINILQNVSPVSGSIATNISENKQKSLLLSKKDLNTDNKITVKRNRRSSSLSVTEYIHNILNKEQVSILDNPAEDISELSQHLEAEKSEILDLTQSSTSSSCNDIPAAVILKENHNFIANISEEKINQTLNKSSVLPDKSDCIGKSRFEKHDSFKSSTSDDINLSQTSQESICISDEELNYSSTYGTPYNKKWQNLTCKDLYESSSEQNNIENDLKDFKNSNINASLNCTVKLIEEPVDNEYIVLNKSVDDCDAIIVDSPILAHSNNICDNQLLLKHPRVKNLSRENTPRAMKSRRSLFDGANLLEDSFNAVLENNSRLFINNQSYEAESSDSPKRDNLENLNCTSNETNTTPKSEMIIKTTNVTPMANYDEMNTPKIVKELQKYGLKPLRHQRGVQILKHIYESTHPIVRNQQNSEEYESNTTNQKAIKRKKSSSELKGAEKSPKPKKTKSRKTAEPNNEEEEMYNADTAESMDVRYQNVNSEVEEKIEIIGDLIGDIDIGDMIFERKQSKKISSCRVPLHIAWHNLVSSHSELRKNILLYEPLQLEILYKMLKEQGHKYHIEDLLTFLDKKCITIRTNQNQNRRNQRRKKSKSPKKCKSS